MYICILLYFHIYIYTYLCRIILIIICIYIYIYIYVIICVYLCNHVYVNYAVAYRKHLEIGPGGLVKLGGALAQIYGNLKKKPSRQAARSTWCRTLTSTGTYRIHTYHGPCMICDEVLCVNTCKKMSSSFF